MSKNIMEQGTNRINIVGTLLDTTFRSGKTADGRAYESATMTIRVTQTFGGREEVSEIPVSMFASQYTRQNKPSAAWAQLQELKKLKTAQNGGIEEAATVRINNASLRENNFVSRNGNLVSSWQINTNFLSDGKAAEGATFAIDVFILDMHPEEDREGEPTGRLILKGGIVQYGGKLDVVEFVVEDPNSVDYVERNWNVNDTLQVRGRIRVTSVEEKNTSSTGGWGEEIPQATTRFVRELVITSGDDAAREEEFAYDVTDIRKAFNVRKAMIEQLQVDAKQKSAKTAAAPTANKYDWE